MRRASDIMQVGFWRLLSVCRSCDCCLGSLWLIINTSWGSSVAVFAKRALHFAILRMRQRQSLKSFLSNARFNGLTAAL